MPRWLLSRLFNAADQPKPRFAFHGTVNWMRALALFSRSEECSDEAIVALYRGVRRRSVQRESDTVVFESMFMSFNHFAGLVSLANDVEHGYDVGRAAVMAWYYSIYFSCRGMIAAASGGSQDSHAATARVWQADIVEPGLVLRPFSLSLSSLVSADYEPRIDDYRAGNNFDLNTSPADLEQAWGSLVSYLNGTADYERWKIEERVRESREFSNLGVENFRTRAARDLRNRSFRKGHVNFLVQAIRYRGKANYRDSLFLSYGDDRREQIDLFLNDLVEVSRVFLRMSSTYCAKRVERGVWDEFVDDIELNSQLSLDVDILRQAGR